MEYFFTLFKENHISHKRGNEFRMLRRKFSERRGRETERKRNRVRLGTCLTALRAREGIVWARDVEKKKKKEGAVERG